MLENAVYSVLSPEGFASILWKDSNRVQEAAEVMKMTAKDLYKLKVIDKIIKEPEDGGAESDVELVASDIKKAILKYVKELQNLSTEELVERRYQKFRAMGEYKELDI